MVNFLARDQRVGPIGKSVMESGRGRGGGRGGQGKEEWMLVKQEAISISFFPY